MSEEKKGIEALKKLASEVDACIELGIEIGKGGVSKEDVIYLPKVVEKVQAIVALIPVMKEAEAEIKELDLAKAIELAIHVAKEVQD